MDDSCYSHFKKSSHIWILDWSFNQQENRETFEPFIEDDVPFDEYCQSMDEDGTWAGHMELQAASLVTHCNICIHRVDFFSLLWSPSVFYYLHGLLSNYCSISFPLYFEPFSFHAALKLFVMDKVKFSSFN